MVGRPPRSSHGVSSAASDVYKRPFPVPLPRGFGGGAAPSAVVSEAGSPVLYTNLRAYETARIFVSRLRLEKKNSGAGSTPISTAVG